jgi:hypothetical protein
MKEECYCWVSDEFDALATEGVCQSGCPKLKLTAGWSDDYNLNSLGTIVTVMSRPHLVLSHHVTHVVSGLISLHFGTPPPAYRDYWAVYHIL